MIRARRKHRDAASAAFLFNPPGENDKTVMQCPRRPETRPPNIDFDAQECEYYLCAVAGDINIFDAERLNACPWAEDGASPVTRPLPLLLDDRRDGERHGGGRLGPTQLLPDCSSLPDEASASGSGGQSPDPVSEPSQPPSPGWSSHVSSSSECKTRSDPAPSPALPFLFSDSSDSSSCELPRGESPAPRPSEPEPDLVHGFKEAFDPELFRFRTPSHDPFAHVYSWRCGLVPPPLRLRPLLARGDTLGRNTRPGSPGSPRDSGRRPLAPEPLHLRPLLGCGDAPGPRPDLFIPGPLRVKYRQGASQTRLYDDIAYYFGGVDLETIRVVMVPPPSVEVAEMCAHRTQHGAVDWL